MSELPIFDHDHRPQEVETVLPEVVAALGEQNGRLATTMRRTVSGHPLPSPSEVVQLVELLRSVLFPGFFGNRDVTEESLPFHLGSTLHRASLVMVDEIHRGLCFACARDAGERTPSQCLAEARRMTAAFLRRLPELRRLLALDAVAAFEGDPACTSTAEAIFCYPGVRAICSHRIAHELHVLGAPIIPRIIAEHAHSETGIDIHPGARIGERFFIDHGTGVVVGETCVIGERVRLYQGVTLGAKSFPLDEHGRPIKGIDRHPVLEDGVVVYSGATILGRVTIGRGSVIGGNVWLTRSVPPGSRIAQARATPESFTEGAGI